MTETNLARIYGKRLFADELGAHTRQLTLGIVRKADKNMFARYYGKHRVAEELKPLVAGQTLAAVLV